MSSDNGVLLLLHPTPHTYCCNFCVAASYYFVVRIRIPNSRFTNSASSDRPVCFPGSSDSFTTPREPCPKSAVANLITMLRGVTPTSLSNWQRLTLGMVLLV